MLSENFRYFITPRPEATVLYTGVQVINRQKRCARYGCSRKQWCCYRRWLGCRLGRRFYETRLSGDGDCEVGGEIVVVVANAATQLLTGIDADGARDGTSCRTTCACAGFDGVWTVWIAETRSEIRAWKTCLQYCTAWEVHVAVACLQLSLMVVALVASTH